MEYKLMQPPFEIKPFEEMNKKEAQKHFDWYVGEIPSRIELLRSVFTATGGNREEIDFTEHSLIRLWDWYINNVDICEKTIEEVEFEKSKVPEWIGGDIRNQKISLGWMSITMDIAIYFAEVIRNNYSSINWGIITKPKSLAYINKPVLLGFKGGLELDTINIISNLALKVVDGEKDYEALIKLFRAWVEVI